MPKKRRFGRVRKLPSGRFQARYLGPDGLDRPAPTTFATRRDAERWLTRVEAEIIQGIWSTPDFGRIPLGEYLATWIDHRTNLRPRTADLYRWLYGSTSSPPWETHSSSMSLLERSGPGARISCRMGFRSSWRRRRIACCGRSSTPLLTMNSSVATPAASKALGQRSRMNDLSPPSRRCSRSPSCCLPAIGLLFFWQRSPVSATASWRPFDVRTSANEGSP